MIIFLNPIIVFFISFLLSYLMDASMLLIVPLLTAIIFSCFLYVSPRRRYVEGIAIAYVMLSILFYDFLPYLPLILYMYISSKTYHAKYLLFLVPFLLHIQHINIYLLLMLIINLSFAIGLKFQLLKSEEVRMNYQKQRDTTKELALVIAQKNKELLLRQEQEIKIATLDERNRIAREIHDNVGHLLSSSLLQIGALQTLEEEPTKKELLQNLRNTLSSAMNSVRSSVHDLHEESIDLEIILQKLIHTYSFCEVKFEYDIIHPFQQEVIYHITALTKECLNNTMKHSNASLLTITIREQPAFYQIIIKDNGTKKTENHGGIGLQSMKERVESLRGYINITAEKGFQVFITLPKEDIICVC